MPLIKSHSNYVLKKKHQNVVDGTIWERDITTIGGINQFAPGQVPIFRDNNFIITVRNDGTITNQYNRTNWKENSGNTIWTLENVSGITSEYEDQNDTKIVLKQDYYDFCDFAYFGSLSELFRASINDILARFPGELYGTNENVYYTSAITEDFERIEERVKLGEGYLVSNPYGINIHSIKKPIEEVNPLKYFADSGYTNYEIIDGDEVSKWTLSTYTGVYHKDTKKSDKITTNYSDGKYVSSSSTVVDGVFPCKGDKIADITINGEYNISAWIGDNNIVYYLSSQMNDIHIRPKEDPYLIDFYNECDNFQKLLLNNKTTPKYKATFSVIKDDEFGYKREMQEFIFPTSDGGYNLDATSYGFNDYTLRLAEIGSYYDERFTDNLYRAMTHEAIKNFDWTYTREYVEGDENEYVSAGEKVQKALRIFAREFDEIKTYIDNITSVNRVTYDDRGNIPNYFLTDICENEGWDIIQVVPYDINGISDICEAQDFYQNTKKTVTPYKNGGESYFIGCCIDGGVDASTKLCEYKQPAGVEDKYKIKTGSTEDIIYDSCADKNRNKIKAYTDTAMTYTYMDVNNEFLRRLKLNSRAIWRHKGTIEGIEMILGMFGLKSKRWVDANDSCKIGEDSWDYEITEYTRNATPLEDPWDTCHGMYKYDWVNSTKAITYDYRSKSNYTGYGANRDLYVPYQGMPVAYDTRKVNEETKRYLYPKFNKDEQYDGNPYFQMKGGWLSKTISDSAATPNIYNFQFDAEGTPVYSKTEKIYKETIRSIRRVENLNQMLSIPALELKNGAVCYVERISGDMVIIDGTVYDIHTDASGKKFVTFTRSGGLITVGNKFFDTTITVYDKNGNPHTYTLDDKLDGYPVDAYFKGEDYSFMCSTTEDSNYTIDSYNIIPTGNTEDNEYSNYFVLDDIDYSNVISSDDDGPGWRRLKKTSCEYKKINTIINYNKGNNPHTGNMDYDGGEEYYEYFRHLFKYAYENDLFDERCYNDYLAEIDDIYSGASFEISEDNEDRKVHYFGNYKMTDGTVVEYTDIKNLIGNDTTYATISTEDDIITNQIMNNKRISISFNIKKNFSSPDGMSKLKFFDEIVMNYLTQLVPSTAIFDVSYKFSDSQFEEIKCC